MKASLQKICSVILSAVLLCSILSARVEANFEIPGTCLVQADDGATYVVKTLDYAYANNTYFSLRDMAMVFRDTDKAFSLEITRSAVSLSTGNAYKPVGAENTPWETAENPGITLQRNEFKVDGQTVYYYTLITRLPSGYYDCFMMAADLAMILDVDISVPVAGFLQINTEAPFYVSPDELEQAGYFYGVNGVLVGDATTGEIYYQYQSDTPYPIASTTKLMTYLLTMDAISAGLIRYEDMVTISAAAQLLADSDDGVVALVAGEQISVRDLLVGLLLPSSNECALCLAETIAGTEEAFVQMMNQKAQELGLTKALFFNSNGLPCYTQDPIPAKRQNRMSAEDMFRLASYILRIYPQVTDITSKTTATLQYHDIAVRNTNPLLRNMSEVTGLKTGTTNKAGACLVTSLAADNGETRHDLVVVVLGTENSIERGRVSALLARFALNTFYAGTGIDETEDEAEAPDGISGNLPTQAKTAVEWVLRTARKH